MKTKKHYTAPVTQRATVELEGGFCGSIIDNTAKTVNMTSSAQDYESFESNVWKSDGTQDANGAVSWGN